MKKVFNLLLSAVIIALVFVQCDDDDDMMKSSGMFTVTIENVSTVYDYFEGGAQFIPDNMTEAGPAKPGDSFTVKFHASKGHRLSFASMYGASNDLFYAPSDDGISLFNGDDALTGDITGLISLWDAGTEVNHAPGSKEDGDEESKPIKSLRNVDNVNDGFDYNNVEENIKVMLDYDGVSMFTLKIHVLEGSSTPLSPVAWVVHSDSQNPIYKENELDFGNGLEMLAETGNAEPLGNFLEMHSGYTSPLAPGVWVLNASDDMPLFKDGMADYGDGLEALAEDGDPSGLAAMLTDMEYTSGVFNTPSGSSAAGPLLPGSSYSFSFTAEEGTKLSFATMLVHTNDLFFAPGGDGIELFNSGTPISGDITSMIYLWDAGTEVNQYPGAGINQPARLNGGEDENGEVMMVNDGFDYPDVDQIIKVTVSSN